MREPTPEQLERRREVNERCRMPAPKSGTFGKPGPPPKVKGE